MKKIDGEKKEERSGAEAKTEEEKTDGEQKGRGEERGKHYKLEFIDIICEAYFEY